MIKYVYVYTYLYIHILLYGLFEKKVGVGYKTL